MTKLITLLIGFALACAAGAQAKQAEKGNAPNKKSKPAPQQQVAPKHQSAPKHQTAPNAQVQKMPKQSKNPNLNPDARVHHNTVSKQQHSMQKESTKAMKKASKTSDLVQPNTVPAVQNRVNKTVK